MTLRVLIIDDSVADFSLFSICLRQALGDDVTTEHAASIETAGELLANNEYSVIFHDLFMPPWGVEAITAAYKRSPNTPIIAISGASSPELHRMAIANGARLFCAKSDLRADTIASILAPVLPAFKDR